MYEQLSKDQFDEIQATYRLTPLITPENKIMDSDSERSSINNTMGTISMSILSTHYDEQNDVLFFTVGKRNVGEDSVVPDDSDLYVYQDGQLTRYASFPEHIIIQAVSPNGTYLAFMLNYCRADCGPIAPFDYIVLNTETSEYRYLSNADDWSEGAESVIKLTDEGSFQYKELKATETQREGFPVEYEYSDYIQDSF